MKPWKLANCALALGLAAAPRLNANNAGAVVLVNSQSARYLDFTHFLQPYLGNFGVPCTVLDIASNAVGANLTNYALIIVGHAQLDTNGVYLTATAQSNLSWAVSNGVGLVSFDNALASNTTPLYQFEQDIFGLAYTNAVTSGSVMFPPTQAGSTMHYITALHLANETLVLSNANNTTTMTVAGLKLPTNDTAVATCGGAPFVVVAKYGQGRAVQWTSYDWMSSSVQGPLNGLDDLVWRGLVWAARKPFVLRGMPHLATMRIDDVTGDSTSGSGAPPPFWWVHYMTNAGFKPFLALFIDEISYASGGYPGDHRLNDLSNLVASGSVTASVHSFSENQMAATNFFYFNHATESEYPDAEMAQNYQRGTAFLTNNGIASSTAVIAHFSEMGTNSFNGLTNWGVQYVMIEVVPGTVEYLAPYAPWLVAGPYRLYETPGQGQVNMPMFYADWLTVPNHPELNGKFFDCYTEIRNVGPDGEWAPGADSVAGSISRGYAMLKRGFDSMVLGNIFTHEFYIDPSGGLSVDTISTNDFAAMLQGITNEIASYNPIYVTMDYAFQYVRATRTSQLASADYNPVTGQITASLAGYTDLPITAYYYLGADNSITNIAGTVPVFSGSTNVTLGWSAQQPVIMSPGAAGGNFTFTLVGPFAQSYSIDGSSNLQTWLSLQTVTLTNGPVLLSVPANATNQFIRARLLP
jgi:hypothetical protein